ncbi:Putative PUA-like superfamily, SRA-YDG superfamily protein [Septoria linicola]|uniref:PUA-like superfamily, SRA-YDG superfamily protein n=1 Tax=Septoria linicola TaxID=215465 RepID=A0A9Q9AV84_9PEZI|nr:Putative PUA-like superfamily, SRA-YDG superfamily protein [Septoria linicola]
MLALWSSKAPVVPQSTARKPYFAALDQVLSLLENGYAMTPELKQESQIHKILQVVCLDARYNFPAAWTDRARKLYDQFEADNWGGMAEIKDEIKEEENEEASSSAFEPGLRDVDDTSAGAERPTKRHKSTSQRRDSIPVSGNFKIIQPPTNHPIWGESGIMHGIALRLKPDGSLSKGLNPAFEKRDPKVHGHNGIEVGQWYANRLAAIFRGAHGASQAGISGSPGTGAYSVVVSGQYEDLDTDEGETVFYSGSGSHENEDPNQPATSTTGTRILHASLKHGKVIRLLRTSSANIQFAPVEGLRYEGLYKVIAMDTPRNARGGKYERFKLVRESGQPSLAECTKRPTPQELRDYNKINAGYSGYGMNRRG